VDAAGKCRPRRADATVSLFPAINLHNYSHVLALHGRHGAYSDALLSAQVSSGAIMMFSPREKILKIRRL
jgi:hypothetical protein